MNICGFDREVRAKITDDGQVLDVNDRVVGFINEDGTSGDDKENFLGEINEDGQISDADNKLLGSVNLGTAEMRTIDGSHFCTVQSGGEISDHLDSFRGIISHFSFHKLKIIAAYLFFFDQNLLDPKLSSKIVDVTASDETNTDNTPPEPAKCESEPAPAPPVEQVKPTINLSPPVAAVPARKISVEDRNYKNYRVGEFLTVAGGNANLLEIFDCDCQISQLHVRLEKDGKQVVFQRTIQTGNNRKQQIQRFSVPYTVSPDRLEAKYDAKKDGGTLSLLLKKPDPNSGSSTSSLSGEFAKFNIIAVSGSECKVSMKPTQTKEYILFEVTGDSKLDTEIVGELVDGTVVKFHAITTDLAAGTRRKATQSFELPFGKVTLDHITIEDGKKVKVYPKSVQGSDNTSQRS